MMNSIIMKARNELDLLAKNVPQGKHMITADIRKVSSKLYRTLDNSLLYEKQNNIKGQKQQMEKEVEW